MEKDFKQIVKSGHIGSCILLSPYKLNIFRPMALTLEFHENYHLSLLVPKARTAHSCRPQALDPPEQKRKAALQCTCFLGGHMGCTRENTF